MGVVDIGKVERYKWGGASEGWHLPERADLSVIQEFVPAGDRVHRHYHSAARHLLQ